MALSLPDGPRGRALALGLTAVVLAAVWLAVAQPLANLYADGADELDRRAALAGRMEELAASLPALQRAAQADTTAIAPSSATLSGSSDSVAAAALQGLLETMANGAGAHVTSAEALPAEQVGQYRRISLRVTVEATWPNLIHMLQQVERATPRMFLDELQIHAQPAAEKLHEPPLDISFVVLAFRSGTADAQSPAAQSSAAQSSAAQSSAAQSPAAQSSAAQSSAAPPSAAGGTP